MHHYYEGRTLPDRCVVKVRPAGSLFSISASHYCVVRKRARVRSGIKPCTNDTFVYYGSLTLWSSANSRKLPCSFTHRCVVEMRPPGTPVSCTVVIQYYAVPNSKESLLRRPHAAGSLCSEDASTGHPSSLHSRNSILRLSQQ